MSLNSFPRPEHIGALKARADALAKLRSATIEISEDGLDRFRCQYRLRIVHSASGHTESVSIHFQLADKLLHSAEVTQVDRLLNEAIGKCLASVQG